ncbi:beta-1,3-galactosyltransferase 1-like [Hydractinia symbiolongicarpus]|uniref:beta-1,3-galactosyltransferase 1-like n=1 Tax=Hydractinia symbiolongicarpus TaxID=13093 RepID=UPI00254DCB0F|nr:beta-1,3-galactosyltransferase 1-like [Hydractinia symbiolongicarpus]
MLKMVAVTKRFIALIFRKVCCSKFFVIFVLCLLYISIYVLPSLPNHNRAKIPTDPNDIIKYNQDKIVHYPINVSYNLFLLILVSSSPHDERHREKREAIRKTWGRCKHLHTLYKESKYIPKNITCKLVFFMGTTRNPTRVSDEAKKFQDIILVDYIDTYDLITRKLLATFKWSMKYKPKFILKADDDVYVHLPRLIMKLQHVDAQNYYGGWVYKTSVPRDHNHRHYVSYKTFSEPTFPSFCVGAMYVFSGNLLSPLLQTVDVWAPFGVDDAYVGVLMRHISVTPSRILGFLKVELKIFLYEISDCALSLLIGYGDGLSGQQIVHIHRRIKSLEQQKSICMQVNASTFYGLCCVCCLILYAFRTKIYSTSV